MQAALALVLSVAVFGSAVQAGRIYYYCTAMDSVMLHACCGQHADRQAQGAQIVAPACCQSRSPASLEAFTPSPRADHELVGQALPAPLLAAVLGVALPQPFVHQAPRTWAVPLGLEKLRVHARMMVFQV